MNLEQVAEKLSAHMYSRLKKSEGSFSYEEYWNRNRDYFLDQARLYLRVKESLKEQDNSAAVSPDKRTEERTSLISSVFYTPVSRARENGNLWGVTTDVSHSGVGMYTDHALEEGSSVRVHSEDLWNDDRTARIKWCKEVRKKLYRSGLFFVQKA